MALESETYLHMLPVGQFQSVFRVTIWRNAHSLSVQPKLHSSSSLCFTRQLKVSVETETGEFYLFQRTHLLTEIWKWWLDVTLCQLSHCDTHNKKHQQTHSHFTLDIYIGYKLCFCVCAVDLSFFSPHNLYQFTFTSIKTKMWNLLTQNI